MNRVAFVTGAGSGVGRAIVLALVSEGWSVALVGRRESALRETIQLAGQRADPDCLCCPCDIGVRAAVEKVAEQVLAWRGRVDLVVNAAGTNTPKRSLEVLSDADYQLLVNTNLDGAYYCVQAFLPGMRSRGSGMIVNIVSDAGKQANAKAGPAYVMAKFGLAGLTQSINAEERSRGVRACAIFPGDIDTPLLNLRPAPPSAAARSKMLQPEDVAACAMLAINLPARAIIEEILVRPA